MVLLCLNSMTINPVIGCNRCILASCFNFYALCSNRKHVAKNSQNTEKPSICTGSWLIWLQLCEYLGLATPLQVKQQNLSKSIIIAREHQKQRPTAMALAILPCLLQQVLGFLLIASSGPFVPPSALHGSNQGVSSVSWLHSNKPSLRRFGPVDLRPGPGFANVCCV